MAERLAVVAIHGMGQQVPYQTIDDMRRGLKVETVAHRQKLGEHTLSYVSTQIDGKDVDLFEAYWAPTTEGRVTLRDVMTFLRRAVANGIATGFKGPAWAPERGGERRPGITFGLLYVGAVVLSLVAMNTVIVALTGSYLAGLRTTPPAVVADLTWSLVGVIVLAGVFLAVAALSMWRPARRVAGPVAYALLHVALVGIIGWFALAGVIFARGGGLTATWPGTVAPVAVAAVWIALAAASFAIRHVLVQYLGDVAAYVSSHKLDRFDTMRDEVRASVEKTLTKVYAAKDGDAHRYTDVSIVAHSLGSVVGYETLNGMILADEDAPADKKLHVARRTRLFLTFGSPLDKTTYLFAQSGKEGGARNALIALKQPFLTSAESRPRAWINVFTPYDPASGPLDYFHGPDPARRVINKLDPDAKTPLFAHNQYWENETLWSCLRGELAKQADMGRTVGVARSVPVKVPEDEIAPRPTA